jgi:hypothetical protein
MKKIPGVGALPAISGSVFSGRGLDSSDQDLHLPLLELHFGSQGIGAVGAQVLVLIPLRQN